MEGSARGGKRQEELPGGEMSQNLSDEGPPILKNNIQPLDVFWMSLRKSVPRQTVPGKKSHGEKFLSYKSML